MKRRFDAQSTKSNIKISVGDVKLNKRLLSAQVSTKNGNPKSRNFGFNRQSSSTLQSLDKYRGDYKGMSLHTVVDMYNKAGRTDDFGIKGYQIAPENKCFPSKAGIVKYHEIKGKPNSYMNEVIAAAKEVPGVGKYSKLSNWSKEAGDTGKFLIEKRMTLFAQLGKESRR